MTARSGERTPAADVSAQIRQLQGKAKELGARDIAEQRYAAAILAREFLKEPNLRQIIASAVQQNVPLTKAVTDSKLLNRQQMLLLSADAAGLPFIDLDDFRVHDSVLGMLPAEMIRSQHVLPYKMDRADGGTVYVAMANPNHALRRNIEQLLAAKRHKVLFAVTDPHQLKMIAQRRLDQIAAAEGAAVLDEDANASDDEPDDILAEVDEVPIQLFHEIFAEAVQNGASDVHLEPAQPNGLTVRMRIDGVMQYVRDVPEALRRPVMAVAKLRCNMDVSERRRPQSGRYTFQYEGRRIDLRAEYGPIVGDREQMVIRILDQEGGVNLDLSDMGLSAPNLERYMRAVSRPQGAILITGPTGSGKSSTLYATLKHLTDGTTKILTIEDPVEYQLPGIQQMQVNPNLNPPFEFKHALKAALRMDPDVVMVGEIRDDITAETALRAANTGHLMLSTLHTNEAAAAPMQLLQMGVPATVVAQAISAIVAQRLARRLCQHCKIRYTPSVEELVDAGYREASAEKLAAAAGQYQYHRAHDPGCDHCTRGYRGRLAIHEVLLIEDEERALLLSNDPSMIRLRDLAVSKGTTLLRVDGLNKVAAGMTSISEIMRVARD